MRNTSKILFVMFFAFALLSFVSGLEVKKTEVVIVTDPYQNMSVIIKDVDGEVLPPTFAGRARKFGEYRFTYYGVVDKINLEVSIINNDTQETLVSKDFGPYIMGTPVNVTLKYLDSTVGTSELVPSLAPDVNITTNVTNSSAPSTPLTGRVVDGTLEGFISKLSPVYYYVFIGMVGLGIFAFVMRRKMLVKHKSLPKEPDHHKMFNKKEEKALVKEEFTPPADTAPVAEKPNVTDLQQKITDLQKQLEQVRGEEKLIRLQRQLAREQQELKKLNNPSAEPKKDFGQGNSGPSGNSI